MLPSGVLAHHLVVPTPQDTLNFLQEHLQHRKCLLQLVAECEVTYVGRAMSTAEAGDYMTLIKPDGCLMVHGPVGVKPRNWQPNTDALTAKLEDGLVVLTGFRRSPRESVSIRILECFTLQAFSLREDTGFVLSSSEADMQRVLRQQPELIEPGLSIIDHELPTGVGSVDLYARDMQGCPVVIELKRGKATHEAAHQLARYVEQGRAVQSPGTHVRGCSSRPTPPASPSSSSPPKTSSSGASPPSRSSSPTTPKPPFFEHAHNKRKKSLYSNTRKDYHLASCLIANWPSKGKASGTTRTDRQGSASTLRVKRSKWPSRFFSEVLERAASRLSTTFFDDLLSDEPLL